MKPSFLSVSTKVLLIILMATAPVLGWSIWSNRSAVAEEVIHSNLRISLFEQNSLQDEYYMYHGERAKHQWLQSLEKSKTLLRSANEMADIPDETQLVRKMDVILNDVSSIFMRLAPINDFEIVEETQENSVILRKRLFTQLLARSSSLVESANELQRLNRTKVDRTYMVSFLLVILFVIVTVTYVSLSSFLAITILKENESTLVEARENAVQANRAKGEFLAKMSHEIRTPINGVIGIAALLKETNLSPEQKHYVEIIRSSGDSLLTLVNDILDLSKAEAGKIDLESVDFGIHQMISDVERTLEFAAKKNGLEIHTKFSPDTPDFVFGDPTRLRQVLVNLVSNAIKFMSQGNIQILVSKDSEIGDQVSVIFEVMDSGIGIPKEALSRMFKAFSQADNTTTRRFGGTGLGLSISKHLVHLMGGEIGVKSTQGVGSNFWFRIPFKKSATVASKHSGQVETEAIIAKRSLRILLAEDNSVNQLIAVKMLNKVGHTVVVAANGNEVIDALRVASYDLILMDCQMPEMDGYMATQTVRNSQTLTCNSIPIIAMTANATAGDREKCLAAGMDSYVSKPVTLHDLQAEIETVMNNRAAAA